MRGSVRKRGRGSWRVVVDVERGLDGKRKQMTFTVRGTKKDAEAALSKVLADIENGGFVEPSKLTVGEFLERWLKHVETKTSAKTHERYSEIVRLAIYPALGTLKLTSLRPLHIQNFYGDVLSQGRVRTGKSLSPRTVLHYHRVLFQALKQAVKWRLLNSNPADAVEPPVPERKEMQALDENQTAILLQGAKSSVHYVAILLAVTTGMRRGEVLALRWCDVDLDKSTLHVVQTVERTKSHGLRFKQPKTKRSRRLISLPSISVDALRKHRAVQKQDRLRMGVGWSDSALVCALSTGEPVSPPSLTKAFSALVSKLGLPKIRFHDLRHTHATQMLKQGVHPKVAQERLGHATIAVTLDLYSHVMPGMQEDAASRMDIALKAALGRVRDQGN